MSCQWRGKQKNEADGGTELTSGVESVAWQEPIEVMRNGPRLLPVFDPNLGGADRAYRQEFEPSGFRTKCMKRTHSQRVVG
jgi:hypothetical protein